jgi:hypothetical protein
MLGLPDKIIALPEQELRILQHTLVVGLSAIAHKRKNG